jgi:hypothetical protein
MNTYRQAMATPEKERDEYRPEDCEEQVERTQQSEMLTFHGNDH